MATQAREDNDANVEVNAWRRNCRAAATVMRAATSVIE
jgi:hypothetical protein